MSSEDYEGLKAMDMANRELRRVYGVQCPECVRLRPKAQPTKMLPQQRCKVDGYVDPRPILAKAQVDEVYRKFGLTRKGSK